MPKETKLHYLGNRHLIKRCAGYFKPYFWLVVAGFASSLVVSPASGGLALLVKYVMDDVLIAKDKQMLFLCTVGLIVLMIIKGLFRFLQNYIMNVVGLRVLEDLRNDLFAKIVRLPMPYFADSQIGMLMSRLLNDVVAIRMSVPSLVMLVREVVEIGFLVGVIIYMNASLAFWGLVVMPAAIFPFYYFGKKIRKYGRKTQSSVSDVNVVIEESLNGVKVIKTFANEEREQNRLKLEVRRLTRLLCRQILYSEASSRVMEFVGAAAGGLVLWYGGMQVINGGVTPGEITAFLAALIQVYEPFKKINDENLHIQQALAGAERVFDIFDSPDIQIEEDGHTRLTGSFKSLEFRDVRFTYPGANSPALDGVSLAIEAGKRVAVVGPSGSGKTTLVNLIPRFYDPQLGSVFLNSRPLKEYTLASLRMHLGMVSQEAFLFNASVRDNIAYARGHYSQQEIEHAAVAAYAHEFIMEMPQGYDTQLGERGVKISGGQKQRLTIARALLKNPPLLILDEATSALDTESERIVQSALENLMEGRTSIVIAHRLSTVLSADSIVVMEQGRVVARGTHQELLLSCPLYKKLYDMQFSDQ